MRVLAVTNMYPTARNPTLGVFVEQQVKGLKQIGVDVDVLAIDRASKGVAAYWDLRRQIDARITQFRPDLVHAMYGGVVGYITTRNVARIPVVVSFCGTDLLGAPLSNPLPKFLARYGVLASRKAARKASGIIVKSKNLQRALPGDVLLSKVRIIPNGIDLDRFKCLDRAMCQHKLGWRDDRFHVLFSSNWGDPVKRPDLAQAAVKRLGDDGVPVEFHQLSGVSHEDVPIWLNASNVLLLTSITEGSPNIVKEALACNLPIVSVDVGDVGEQFQAIEGCYVGTADAADLAAKLKAVRSGAGRVAGRMKMEQLSLVEVAKRIANFYTELVELHMPIGAVQRETTRSVGATALAESQESPTNANSH